jgi:hypothetical protein
MTAAGSRVLWAVASLAVAFMLGAGIIHAQQQVWNGGYGYAGPPRFPTATTFGKGFNFCRLMFQSNRREKRGWDTDYPGADINFSVRLAELTKTRVSMTHASEDGIPDHVVVRATDPALFQCPFVLVEDGGGAHFNEQEVIQLREYLLKGGFLFASDYWGARAGRQWEQEIGRVLPPERYPISRTTIRSGARSSRSTRYRRCRRSSPGGEPAAAPRSAGPTARPYTRGRLPTTTAGSWS